jgi:MFS family permease
MCTAAADNYTHLLVIRFFLGATESPYFPGALFLLSSWYTKKVSRISLLQRNSDVQLTIVRFVCPTGTSCTYDIRLKI